MAGDNAIAQTLATHDDDIERQKFMEAVVYYSIASSPHTNDLYQRAALAKAQAAYQEAADELETKFRAVEIPHAGAEFTAYLHEPVGAERHPVLVMSYGSDVSKESAFVYFQNHLAPQGFALLSLDTPGMGSSADYAVVGGDTDQLHRAAVAWAKGNPNLDNDKR